jgi:hypothetical protein
VSFLVVCSVASATQDIRGARVASNAVVLDPNGFTICNAAGNQQEPAVVFDGTDCLVAWRDRGLRHTRQALDGAHAVALADLVNDGVAVSRGSTFAMGRLPSGTARTMLASEARSGLRRSVLSPGVLIPPRGFCD